MIITILWVFCGVLAWGFYQGAHRSAEYNWLPPRNVENFLLCLCGPVNLLAVACTYGCKNFSWKPMSKEESWQAWIERGWGDSTQDRSEFEEWYSGRLP